MNERKPKSMGFLPLHKKSEARDLQYALKDRASPWTLATILTYGISGAILKFSKIYDLSF